MKSILLLALLAPDMTKVGHCGRAYMAPFNLPEIIQTSILKEVATVGHRLNLTIKDQVLMLAIMRQESGFRQDVKGPTGDVGIMQITAPALLDAVTECNLQQMPDISTRYGNILVGGCYLRWIKRHLKNDTIVNRVISYNAGLSRTSEDVRNLPKQTLAYAVRVENWVNQCYKETL